MNIDKIRPWFNGEILIHPDWRKYYPIALILVSFFLLYIYLGYRATSQQHLLTDTKREMQDAKYEYLTISAELTSAKRQTHIADELEKRGSRLQVNARPPILLDE